jgi:putative ABC transport system permease protein
MPLHPRRPTTAAGRLGGTAAAVLRLFLPRAERDEVLEDLAAEYAERRRTSGVIAPRLWLWRQVLGSVPPLVRRACWRGWTGFEPRASRFHSGGPVFESWIVDLRYSARRLSSRPTYTLLAVLTLALGVSGTAAIFSVVRALLLEPLPIAREHEVGVFWMEGSWTEREFLHLRPDVPGFDRVAAFKSADGATLELPGEPLRLLRGVSASAELFDVLGAGAWMGRTFGPGDDVPGAEPVAVLSHRLWQELGADAAMVGRHLLLGGGQRTIVGVMPPGFWFPDPTIEVWLARALDPAREVGELGLIGRVAEGRSLGHMEAPLGAIVAALGQAFAYPPGEWDKTRAPAITPIRDHLVGDIRPALVATFVAMALILLIACVNVSALMLGQVGGRASELAVRSALGAGRQRLLQQFVAESMVIGALAGLAGALLAAASFGLLLRSLPLGALAESATLDWTIFWSALALALPLSAGLAVVPASAVWRSNLQGTMAAARTTGITTRGGRLEAGLVVSQVALAVLLAAGAGMLIRSVANLRAIDAGVDVRGVAVLDATVPTEMNAAERRRTYLAAIDALQSLPGLRAAAATQRLPLLGSSDNWGIAVEGRPDLGDTTTAVRLVTRDYFEALGVRVLQGRGFLRIDHAGTPRVVVVNEALAAKYFPGEDPVGRVIHTGFDAEGERIVGVVQDVAEARLTDTAVAARYMLYEQVPGGILPGTSFVLRAVHPEQEAALIATARQVLARDVPRLAVHRVTTMEALLDQAVGPAGQVVRLVSLLAALALVLGGIGVYGMVSHFVTRRSREYGIRIALGLPPARVLSEVVRRGLRLVAFGSLVGVAAALALTRLLGSLLYGVSATDAPALAGAVLALLVAGALAALVPARRASRTDPAVVLREQ